MEWLLTILSKPRYLLAAVALALALRYQGFLTQNAARLYQRWKYPAQGPAAAAGEDILREIDAQTARKVLARHRRLTALLDKAEAKGVDVKSLRVQADQALAYNAQGSRQKALELLARIEGSLPRQGPSYAPADPSEEELEIPPDSPGKEVAAGSGKPGRKGAKRKGKR